MELSSRGSGVCPVTECVRSKIGQILGQLPIFTLSIDVSTTTVSEQPKGYQRLKKEVKVKVKIDLMMLFLLYT